MKLIHILKPILLFCLVFSIHIQAQNNVPIPSQERVEELLEGIKVCKKNIAISEKSIKTIEENPDSYTLADYNFSKLSVKLSTKCMNEDRAELDKLRKGYSGWFNSPNATMSLGRDRDITPRELEDKVATIEELAAAIMETFENLEVPEN